METTRTTQLDSRTGGHSQTPNSEWIAPALRPIAHWVLMPGAAGRSQLEMVWEVPDPVPPAYTA